MPDLRLTRVLCLLLAAALGSAACDRTPTDPALEPGLDSPQSSVFAAAPTSLPKLLQGAIARVEAQQGSAGVRKLLSDWRRLNDDARTALTEGDRQLAQSRIDAVRTEELRIVSSVLGDRGVHQVVRDVALGLAWGRLDWSAAEASGKDLSQARDLADQITKLLLNANRALGVRDYPTALDHATRASDRLDGLRHFLIALYRIPGLETMFGDAVAQINRERDVESARTLLSASDLLNEEARVALRSGNRERARQKLEAARQEQIRIVLRVKGPGVVAPLLGQIDDGIASTRPRIARLTDTRLAQRATRMVAEAASLGTRARMALNRGDAATSLDLASHAAGVVNALQHLLPR
jgi:hypothetical protein